MSRFISCLVLVLAICVAGAASAERPRNVKPVVGNWSGTGTLYKPDLRQEVGPLDFSWTVAPDLTGAGKIGAATFRVTGVKHVRQLIEVTAELNGPPSTHPALAKTYLVFLLTNVSKDQIDGEIHLKKSAGFDAAMREAKFSVTRN